MTNSENRSRTSSVDPLESKESGLRALSTMASQIAELEDNIAETVAHLRSQYVSWADIADELGMASRQAAQQRYGSSASQ